MFCEMYNQEVVEVVVVVVLVLALVLRVIVFGSMKCTSDFTRQVEVVASSS